MKPFRILPSAFILLLLALVGVAGCTTQALDAQRALVKADVSKVITQHTEWAAFLAGEPGAKPLPSFNGRETPEERHIWFHAVTTPDRELRAWLDGTPLPTTRPVNP